MSDDDSEERLRPKPKRQLKEKKRVTLAFKGPPLAFPGDANGVESSGPPSEPGLPRMTPPKPNEEGAPHDAWSRARVARGSGVHKAVASPPIDAPPVERLSKPYGGGALDLVNRRRPSEPDLDLATEMTERFALDDFTGSLRAAELLLGSMPDHSEGERYATLCRERLDALYSARLSSLGTLACLAVPATEVRWLGIDNRAGFILSRIDGKHTVDEIVDVSGMPRLEVLKTLIELLDAGTIRFAPPADG